jgi:hypothetical protein
MTIAQQIKARLDEIEPVYHACQTLQPIWLEAETLEKAHEEYHNRINEEKERLDLLALQQRLTTRLWEKGQLEQPQQEEDQDEPPPDLFPQEDHGEPPALNTNDLQPPPPPSPPPSLDRRAIVEARRELRRVVDRLMRTWRFDRELQGKINRIAEDKETPLGEALVLLEWKMFEGRADRHETEAEHLDRLGKWGEALKEYHDWLERRIHSLHSQYRSSHSIWELWKGRGTAEGSRAWQSFLKKKLEEKQAKAQSLRAEISRLEREIAERRLLNGERRANSIT